MKKIVAIGVAIALSITSISPAKGNPAVLAPAAGLCGTGIGCILVGTVVIGGVLYYVYTHQGKKVYVPVNRENNRFESRAISSEQAHKMGDAHWSNTIEGCRAIGKRIGKPVQGYHPATGPSRGFWCIFSGSQTSFGED